MKRIARTYTIAAIGSAIAAASAMAGPNVVIRPDEPQSQDAWAYEFTPTTDQNVDFFSILPVGDTGPGSPHDLESYLRFSLAPYALSGSFVQSARLELFVIASESTGFGASPTDALPLPIGAHGVTGPWSEALTWNTRPTHSSSAVGTTTLNSSSIDHWIQLDVTPLVVGWLDTPSSNFGVAIIAQQALRNAMGMSVITAFLSSSTDSKPALTIEFNATPGDADLDGKVDVADLGLLASHWQTAGATWQDGDFDNNGSVDVNDLGPLATNWQAGVAGASNFGQAATQFGLGGAVPEPSSAAILLAVTCSLARRHRHKDGHTDQ